MLITGIILKVGQLNNMKLESKKLSFGGVGAKQPVDFSGVIKKLKGEGSSAGFRSMRDYLLMNYKNLKDEFGPLGLMNLIMACDKHAIFVDMSAEKNKEHDQVRWKVFQDYMNGKVAVFENEVLEEQDDELSIQEGEQAGEHGSHGVADGESDG